MHMLKDFCFTLPSDTGALALLVDESPVCKFVLTSTQVWNILDDKSNLHAIWLHNCEALAHLGLVICKRWICE